MGRSPSILDIFRNRVLIGAIVPLVVVAVVLMLVFYQLSANQARTNVQSKANTLEAELQQFLLEQKTFLANLSHIELLSRAPVERGYSEGVLRLLRKQYVDHPANVLFGVFSLKGELVDAYPLHVYSVRSSALKDIASFNAKEVSDTHLTRFYLLPKPQLSGLVDEYTDSHYIVSVTRLFASRSRFENLSQVSGTLITVVPVSKFGEFLQNHSRLGRQGELITLRVAGVPIYANSPDGAGLWDTRRSIDTFFSSRHRPLELELIVADTDRVVFQVLFQTALATLILLALLVSIILYVMKDFQHAIATPLKQIAELSRQISEGQFTVEKHEFGFSEFDEIESALGVMGDTIRKQIETITWEKLKAESSTRLKSEFLANMSHEIRTPLNGIMGMLSLLDKTPLTENQKQRLNLARSSAESLGSIIDDILDFSKIESGKLEFEQVEFSFSEVVGEVCELLAIRASSKNIELCLDCSALGTDLVLGDSTRVRQVLTNIVGNAIKFTETGYVAVHCYSPLVEYADTEVIIRCEVRDSGIGISEAQQQVLFQSFSQADTSTTRKYGGSGLGLVISRKLCEMMGGSLSVKSALGQGSTFQFSLCLRSAAALNQLEGVNVPEYLSALLVDANECSRTSLLNSLTGWHIPTRGFADAASALEYLRFQGADFNRAIGWLFVDEDINLSQVERLFASVIGPVDGEARAATRILLCKISRAPSTESLQQSGFDLCLTRPLTLNDLRYALAYRPGSSVAVAPPVSQYECVAETEQRLLVVEDNEVNQAVICGLLDDWHLPYVVAANGRQALDVLATDRNDFAMILMDCQMPEMDGFEATRRIRAGEAGDRHVRVPIVALTANAMLSDRERCVAAGMDDYLKKPIEISALKSALQHWMLVEFHSAEVVPEAEGLRPRSQLWQREDALARVRHKHQRLTILVRMFVADTPDRIAQLEAAVAASDLQQVHFLAHAIKGVAANISAQELSEEARQIEALSSAESVISPELQCQLVAHFARLNQVCKATLSLLVEYLASQEIIS